MIAFVLAAGLGSRLQDLTRDKPKALVEYKGKTMLENVIQTLSIQGFSKIVINVHHFADQIIEFLAKNKNFGLDISISDERMMLRDTGGAILQAKHLFAGSKNILVHNVDIESNLNLNRFVKFHEDKGALASLAINKRQTIRYLLFDQTRRLRAWQNVKTKEIKGDFSTDLFPFAFNGVHVISTAIFDLIKEEGNFSIIDLYLRLATKYPIYGFYSPEYQYKDLGKREIFN